MDIDKDKCVGCGNCHVVCTMGAISLDADGRSVVNQEECVECGTCHRVLRNEGYPAWFVRAIRAVLAPLKLRYLADADLCPTGALAPPELAMPRLLRAQFSNPTIVHPGTGVPGRGTDEIKSNDVTGRLRGGEAGLVVEVGRPGIGARFRDVERVAMALAALAPQFEHENPVTLLMVDTRTGRMRADILDEKVLSAIIELKTDLERIPAFLAALEKVQQEIDSVISVGVASRCLEDGTIPHEAWVQKAGYRLSPNGKTNLGLGRPLFAEAAS
jgi:ferredoxin